MTTPRDPPLVRSLQVWLREQTRRDALIYVIAAVSMGTAGLFASVATLMFASLAAMGFSCGALPWPLAFLAGLFVMGGLWFWHLRFDRPIERTIRIPTQSHGTVTLTISPLTGSSWLMYLDRPAESLLPASRLAVNGLLISPRLCSLAWRMARLARECHDRDYGLISHGLSRLLEGGRVPIGDLLEDNSEANPHRLIGGLTGIEGVVFLGGDEPGLTLTSAFPDEFEQWQRARQRRRRSADY